MSRQFDSELDIPESAIYYIEYGEDDSLTDREKGQIDWYLHYHNITNVAIPYDDEEWYNAKNEFNRYPAWGLPGTTITCKCHYAGCRYDRDLFRIPTWALDYLTTGNKGCLNEGQMTLCEEFKRENRIKAVEAPKTEAEKIFSTKHNNETPAFGEKCDTVRCICLMHKQRETKKLEKGTPECR